MSELFAAIIQKLPYSPPFLFVDEILSADENSIKGTYKLKKDEFFYQGHFPGNPVTPGVIITEVMAQIGLVCFGMYLNSTSSPDGMDGKVPVFTSSCVDFYSPAYPEQTLEVTSSKIYYRFGKLKCRIECHNRDTQQLVCKGDLSGLLVNKNELK
ncbi:MULTISPECIES: 3-hydroxyacyl-ACP dehydratase FabZ family protein [unclassified Imperialibacter]|uniref:3-hydroxyacyl-ACP dehydratase FabZ family protein n=1 Tax=unclassified Imperialibacter TaxID=2629706 RepID=UPI001254785C|nr:MULTISPECIES: hydroxymyristoyl-ACP dehydratase [unclassified Imperialibacter]CAD5255013.1 Hydroxymyristoyl-ACP dehydratase [Imperialibacter sp. 89]CAD5256370.1 Hydroxymyristoyl-ACP dehydratase [Imperialibacter sp. 75]VVT20316.1 conserved hypothetical protein [Imperialibacter sp. EC-SDR9]